MPSGYRELWQEPGFGRLIGDTRYVADGGRLEDLAAAFADKLSNRRLVESVDCFPAAKLQIVFTDGSAIVGLIDTRPRGSAGIWGVYWNGLQAYAEALTSTISLSTARAIYGASLAELTAIFDSAVSAAL